MFSLEKNIMMPSRIVQNSLIPLYDIKMVVVLVFNCLN